MGPCSRLKLNDERTFGGSPGRLVAVGEGFSLHAGTAVGENDRDGLARLCRYSARGPIAESRVSRRGGRRSVLALLTSRVVVALADHSALRGRK